MAVKRRPVSQNTFCEVSGKVPLVPGWGVQLECSEQGAEVGAS